MLKVGVFGVGHLGQIHLKCLSEVSDIEVVGIYDPKAGLAKRVASSFNILNFNSEAELITAVDAAVIACPTLLHFEIAEMAIKSGLHVFVEKPLTHTVQEAEELIRLSTLKNVTVQVGHVERFNPAFTSLKEILVEPMFIEAHRLATFNPRGTDVSVILDLMIHDLDILLSIVKSEVKNVWANGVAVVSETPDIANARIEFENGCVANLTASRMSFKQMRKMRLFQKDAYISIDFLEKSSTIIRLYEENNGAFPEDFHLMELDTNTGKKWVHMNQIEAGETNAIKEELSEFVRCINGNEKPRVGPEEGLKALKLAFRVIGEIDKSGND